MKYPIFILLILLISKVSLASEPSCVNAIAQTKKICTQSKIIYQLVTLFKTYEIYKTAKNIGQACNAAAQISQVSALGNAAYSVNCGNAAKLCKRECYSSKEIFVCENYEEQANLAKLQSVLNALSMTKSEACAKAANYQSPNKLIAVNYFRPDQITYQDTVAKPSLNNDLSVIDSEYYDKKSFKDSAPGAVVNAIEKTSKPFVVGNEKSFAIDKQDANAVAEISDKEILIPSGFTNVGGDNSWISKGGTSEYQDSYVFNLKDFLPSGSKDPRRLPSGVIYNDPAITPANGLTNFQKITRKLNEKRSELMP